MLGVFAFLLGYAAVGFYEDAAATAAPNVAGGFVCAGCGGTCADSQKCAECICLMVPLRCEFNDTAAGCFEESYPLPLAPVSRERTLCGQGCGLP